MDKPKRFALKKFRKEQRLTQTEMSERLKMSKWTYVSIEDGTRSGSRDFWNNLQKEFCIPDSEMWGLQKLS